VSRSSRGFTLLEVLIALAILAGTITTVVATFNQHLSLVVRDKETTTALLLARAKLAEPDFTNSSTSNGTFAPEYPAVLWKRVQTATDYPGLKRYQLTVSWQSEQRSLVLVIYARK
jgi:general secretion pathway protein I